MNLVLAVTHLLPESSFLAMTLPTLGPKPFAMARTMLNCSALAICELDLESTLLAMALDTLKSSLLITPRPKIPSISLRGWHASTRQKV